jgi:hypothetical protein
MIGARASSTMSVSGTSLVVASGKVLNGNSFTVPVS